MSNRQSVRSWLITDILSFLLSLASPVAVIPLGIMLLGPVVLYHVIPFFALYWFYCAFVGYEDGDALLYSRRRLWSLIPLLLVLGLFAKFVVSPIIGEQILIYGTGETALIYIGVPGAFLLSSYLAHVPPRFLVRYRPVGVPERRSMRLWWGLLPVGVVLATTAGLLLNPKMMQPATFVGLFGLLVFGGVLIADRTLTLVRTVTDRQVRFTVTTLFVGYVLAGSIFEVVILTFERPAFLYERFVESGEGWGGPGMAYIIPLALARIVLVLAGPSGLGMTEVDDTELTLSQVAEGSPLLFDAETGDGMFTALAIMLVGIPATFGVVETAWRGRRWIPSYLRSRRTVSKAEDRLDTAQQKFDRGEYEQVTELLAGDDVEQTLDRCQQLARESDSWLSQVEPLKT
jgi:hypothetical protein